MIKAVLFDLDGTLLDRDRSLADFLDRQFERIPAFHAVSKDEFKRRFIALDRKGYVWKDRVYQALVEEWQLGLDWRELLDDYVASFRDHCIGFPGLLDMLGELKARRLKLAIITNGFGVFQMNNIIGLRIERYFDEIQISEIEGLRKPDSRIFQRALQRLGVEPDEAMYVGDHPVNDVEASIQAGLRGVWKEDLAFDRPAGQVAVIKELSELIGILAQLSA